jgi:rRNA maturation endonuclease Nob1
MGDMSAMLRAIYVPFWFIVSILAIGPTLKFLAIRKARIITWRKQNNRCPTCGYDLRATKDRCPECGSPITAIVAK